MCNPERRWSVPRGSVVGVDIKRILIVLAVGVLAGCAAADDSSQVTDDRSMLSSSTAAPTVDQGDSGRLSIELDPGVGGDHGTVAIARLSHPDGSLIEQVVETIGIGGPPTMLVTWSLPAGRYSGAVHLAGCSVTGCPDDLSSFGGPWNEQDSIGGDGLLDPFGPCEFTVEITEDTDTTLLLRHAVNDDNSCTLGVDESDAQ